MQQTDVHLAGATEAVLPRPRHYLTRQYLDAFLFAVLWVKKVLVQQHILTTDRFNKAPGEKKLTGSLERLCQV